MTKSDHCLSQFHRSSSGHISWGMFYCAASLVTLSLLRPAAWASEIPSPSQDNNSSLAGHQPIDNGVGIESQSLSPIPSNTLDTYANHDLTEWFEDVSTQAGELLSEEPEPTLATVVVSQPLEPQLDAGSGIPPENPSVSQANETSQPAGDGSTSDLARQAQNPIANLISVPIQNVTSFGVGQYDRTSNVVNIQPVIPTSISEDWLLINRTIIPIAYQPELAPGVDSAFGLGDITYQGFFSPKNSGNFTWGVGPALVIPTATSDELGSGKWSIGPTAVGLVTSGPIVAGALAFNVWSFAGDGDRADVSLLTLQPFFNYNFEGGWYATTSPIITANWLATGEKWTVPIGGGFGRTFRVGSQPINATLQAYWNVIKPEGAADWTLRAQISLLFP